MEELDFGLSLKSLNKFQVLVGVGIPNKQTAVSEYGTEL